MLEIERKFLVKADFLPYVTRTYVIRQGYIAHENGNSVRVRRRDDEGFLTIKGPSADGMSRFEWEKRIPLDEAEALLALCHAGKIEKERHIVPLDATHVVEVDVFHGDNEGLVMAEIELASPDEQPPLPDWLGQEVTGDRRYYNAWLSKHPYSTWEK